MARRLRFRTPLRLSAGLAVAALMLCLPATSFAGGRQTEPGESLETALSSAGLLSRGDGYASPGGSTDVRALQVRLRRLGHAPGPVDGLFGPLTEGAVERFQHANDLVVDGIVGPRTRARLLPRPPNGPPAAGNSASPLPRPQADPAGHARRHDPALGADRGRTAADPVPEPSGLAPGYAALLGALAAVLAAAALGVLSGRRPRSERPARINLGMVGAALLAVFVAGAAGGAVFATRAAPDRFDQTLAAELHATSPERSPADTSAPTARAPRGTRRTRPVADPGRRPAERRRAARATDTARAAPARAAPPTEPPPARPTTDARITAPAAAPLPAPAALAPLPAPAAAAPRAPAAAAPRAPAAAAPPAPVAPARRTGPVAGVRRRAPSTYTVRAGDSLWPIAKKQLAPSSSQAAVARRVSRLADLNLGDRIRSGDPDLIEAGEQLRLP